MSEEKQLTKQDLIDNGLIMPKNVTDKVFNTLSVYQKDGNLVLPKDYNVGNAMKSAYLQLQNTKDKNGKPFIEVCSQRSIANALLDMAVQGLDVGQKQCYFIVRGAELTLMRSYFGSQLVLKRIDGIKDVWANCIYEGDEVTVDVVGGRKVVTEHKTKFGNENKPVIGAYAVIEKIDGEKEYTIMTKEEIDKCWAKSSSSQHTVHKEFPQEMAKRTVINRACKNKINTDTKNQLLVDTINRTTENEYNNDYTEEIEETISKEQVLEIAQLVGDSAEKLDVIQDYGYATINEIKVEDFEEIKSKLSAVEIK